MTEVFPEVVYRLFRENGFNVEKAIAELHHGYILLHNKAHRSLKLRRELLLEVGSRAQKQVNDLSKFLFLKCVNSWHSLYNRFPAIHNKFDKYDLLLAILIYIYFSALL